MANDEVTENGKTRKRVTRNQFNTSFRCMIEVFITNMMKKRKRLDTAKRLHNEEGRVPTPNKYLTWQYLLLSSTWVGKHAGINNGDKCADCA